MNRIHRYISKRNLVVSLSIFGAAAILAACSGERESESRAADTQQQEMEAAQQYTCLMHENVVLSEPGDCPICEMPLVPVEQASAETGTPQDSHEEHEQGEVYTCPMHPDVVQNEPGKCPECNMDLVPEKV